MEINFPKLEEKIIKYWKENKVFEKSLAQRKRAKDFVFYEGPPTANAKPGIHHVLARAFKDVVCRYKTMKGFRVLRKAGWDTHGLPVEIEVEKKLGLKTKKDVEKYGIAEFNKKCKESVWVYKHDWEKLTERIGYWLDMKNPYITYENNYIETVWHILKKIWEKKLLYEDYKVVPYCPRCQTTLSSHEVALGYQRVKENSIYLKFKVKSRDPDWKNTSILSWTTTPWTLPGNAALAANPKMKYVCVPDYEAGEGYWLVLGFENFKNLLPKGIFSGKYKERFLDSKNPWQGEDVDIFQGSEMAGIEYEPLFSVKGLESKNSYKVYLADFVTKEEGTGIVHIAPMYGEDDYGLGKKAGLPAFHTVNEEGNFIEALGEGLKKLYAKSKEAESLIIEYLKRKDFLFKEELYEHDYPFCWRCNSPLLYYAKKSWFIKMESLKTRLINNNRKINWVPEHLKEGRFGEWLKDLKDWALSRERFWGTPLPVWQCKKCKNYEVIGGKGDLFKQEFSKNHYFLLRHGESSCYKDRVVSSWPEKFPCSLTKKGEKDIKKIAKKIRGKIDFIFSSDLQRTKQTAEIVGKELGIKPIFDERLREFNSGSLNGKPIPEMGKFWDPTGKLSRTDYFLRRFEVKAPEGESWTDLKARVYRFLKDIDAKYQDKRILIVSHEAPLTMIEGALSGMTKREIVQHRLERSIEVGELRTLDFKIWPYDENGDLDFHKPFIDEVKFLCRKCGSLRERVKDVIDVWFDSGSMPFASVSAWASAQKQGKKIRPPELFPADYIAEAVDQTRGWFYTLLAISTLLGFRPPYKNVISLGHVLDEKGEKMSKSKGNTVDPWYIVEKYGADDTRWYFYTVNQPGESKLFSEKELDQSLKKFIMTFWNSFVFYDTYSGKRMLEKYVKTFRKLSLKSLGSLDRWIISRLHLLLKDVTKHMDNYEITLAARNIENFVLEDLSHWYIRRSRARLQGSAGKKDFEDSSRVLGYVLFELSLLSSPFIPFLAEDIYRGLAENPKSVHLLDWPKASIKLIDAGLNKQMEEVREIVGKGLGARIEAGIKVRQPLQKLKIKSPAFAKASADKQKSKVGGELLDLIKDELNVKEVIFDTKIKGEVELDTKITEELREEGIVREVIRYIQDMRKKAGYKPHHRVLVAYSGEGDLNSILQKSSSLILKQIRAEGFAAGKKPKQAFDIEKDVKVGDSNLWLAIKKL